MTVLCIALGTPTPTVTLYLGIVTNLNIFFFMLSSEAVGGASRDRFCQDIAHDTRAVRVLKKLRKFSCF